MKRILFWALSSISALVLLFGYHTSTSSSLPSTASTVIVSGAAGASDASDEQPSSVSRGSGSSSSGSSDSGATTTRTVTGSTASTRWGPVQIELTVTGSEITSVSVLQYPNGNDRDQQINSYALPVLINETLQAQSADIDMVSGASVTSQGYLDSLQSALDQIR